MVYAAIRTTCRKRDKVFLVGCRELREGAFITTELCCNYGVLSVGLPQPTKGLRAPSVGPHDFCLG